MDMFEGLLGQLAGNVDLANLAGKLGLTTAQIEQAVHALGVAHPQPGDTATLAAGTTGLPIEAIQQVIAHIGGEGALARFASLIGKEGGVEGMLGGLTGNLFGQN